MNLNKVYYRLYAVEGWGKLKWQFLVAITNTHSSKLMSVLSVRFASNVRVPLNVVPDN